MLIRIVRMTFHPDKVDTFRSIFEEAAPRIRAYPGCTHLDLWQDVRHPNILTSHSHWHDGDTLDAYRRSDLFASTWERVKPLFAARPIAHSYQVVRTLPEANTASKR